jgi:hypothetical protein
VTKYGTRVPSFEVAKWRVVSYFLTSTAGFAASNGVRVFLTGSYANTVVG